MSEKKDEVSNGNHGSEHKKSHEGSHKHETKHSSHENKSHEKKHEAHHVKHKSKNTNFYQKKGFFQLLSFVLAVLLMASVFTGGFGFVNNTDSFAQKIEEIETKIEQGATIEDVKSSLVELKDSITANVIKKQPTSKVELSDDPVELQFYVMSQCPYGTQVMDAIAPVLKTLGGNVDFKVDFIANENADGSFSSLHGEPEVQGNIVQLCAAKYEPEKYMDMIVCMDQNMQQIPDNWESCAQSNGLDVATIKSCYEGEEGKDLLSESIVNSQQANAQGSPTIYLNGKPYQGGRTSADFMRAICANLDGVSACNDIPKCSTDIDCPQKEGMVPTCVNPGEKTAVCEYKEPVALEAIILGDELCGSACTQITDELSVILKQNFFTGVTYKDVNYENGGKALMEKLGISFLPTFVFDKKITETFAWKQGGAQFQSAFKKVDNYYYIIPEAMGSFFNPAAEVCDNGVDDRDQDGLVDCEDDECAGTMICREEIKQDLKVFVMSECPYGIRGLNAMKEVLENFGDDINFDVHYIATEVSPGQFQALHGQPEVDENIRQLCVKKHNEEKFMDYIWCRNENIKGDWKTCAEQVGVDVNVIDECWTGDEGTNLLSEDIKIAQTLGIGGSPTWLANNQNQFGGIDAETIKSGFCQSNPDLEGCSASLSTNTQGAAPDASC